MSDDAVPPAARLVRDFVNTFEPQIDEEVWTTPARLRDWFAERELMASDATLRPADLATAVRIREGLRSALLGHAGHRVDPAAAENLDQALATVRVRLALADGGPRLVSAGDSPLNQALGRLLDAIRQCAQEGTWHRLKVCDRASCRWAFYDGSRNQARRWCSMTGCGNYVKMRRAYAARTGRTAPEAEPHT